jgi:hypothetical protein
MSGLWSVVSDTKYKLTQHDKLVEWTLKYDKAKSIISLGM